MNDNGSTTWAYGDDTIEPFDDYDDDDEESLSSTAEFVDPLLGTILGGAGSILRRRPRPPVPTVRVHPPARGVDTATLNTPRGSATLRLPDKVVTIDQFRETIGGLEQAINRNTARLNTTQKDIDALSKRIAGVVAKMQREQKLALERLRKEKTSQGMEMLMPILMQQQLQSQIQDHTHTGPGGAATMEEDDNMALMMLPLLMTGSGDNNMLMMALAMFVLNDRK
jgi:hypothetical protein